ncbi:MAG: zinc finger domain-containing protein [Actinomycetaceae bacterium]|nr:zinc finger domain-containing protein [Actinomycetaceae bacterium]
MPEGDSIHRIARVFQGINSCDRIGATSPQGRFREGAALLDSTYLHCSQAVGKHLFMGFHPNPPLASQQDITKANKTNNTLTRATNNAPADDPSTDVCAYFASSHGKSAEINNIDIFTGDPAVVSNGTEPATIVPTANDMLWLHIHLGLYGYWRFSGSQSFRVLDFWGSPGSAHVPARVTIGGDDDTWEAPEPIGQVRLRLQFAHGVADVAGPNNCEIITAQELHAIVRRLGPDPLRCHIDNPAHAKKRFIDGVRSSARPIAQLIMDQSIVAGPGNIYRAECLFRTKISPYRKGKNVSRQRLGLLWDDLCAQMERGLELGRIVTIDDIDIPHPVPEDDQALYRHYIYQRDGKDCLRCGARIRLASMAGRKLFWCPGCQAH